jgi:hypothetical protein
VAACVYAVEAALGSRSGQQRGNVRAALFQRFGKPGGADPVDQFKGPYFQP